MGNTKQRRWARLRRQYAGPGRGSSRRADQPMGEIQAGLLALSTIKFQLRGHSSPGSSQPVLSVASTRRVAAKAAASAQGTASLPANSLQLRALCVYGACPHSSCGPSLHCFLLGLDTAGRVTPSAAAVPHLELVLGNALACRNGFPRDETVACVDDPSSSSAQLPPDFEPVPKIC